MTPLHASAENAIEVFDEAVKLVEERFFDPGMNGLDWAGETAKVRKRLAPDTDREVLSDELNGLLEKLGASHTQFLTRDEPQWYQLVGVFVDGYEPLREALTPHLSNGAPVFTGIGVMLHVDRGRYFISGALHGFPASQAGFLVGDRIVSVDGQPYHPIRSFAASAGRVKRVVVERQRGTEVTLAVTPILIDGRTMFETAMRESARIIETKAAEVAYIRAWSYAGRRYQDIVTRALINGALKDADAFILDIRGGWGGADPSYLNLFADRNITAVSTTRDGEATRFSTGWSRPVVLLVDGGSRSGKELLAYGFRALEKGPIVGETTAGAVLAGQINALADGSVLFIAVTDVTVDGVRLEGRGVEPDITIPFDVPYAAGADPQLDRALEVAADLARDGR
jgi:carboxyl-terminal processing protease